MNVSAVQNQFAPHSENARNTDLRAAAQQFESILLMQLTSALSGANNDDEDKLFGGDGGSNLAQQLFSEQLAKTIADAGGVGLADLLMQRLPPEKLQAATSLNQNFGAPEINQNHVAPKAIQNLKNAVSAVSAANAAPESANFIAVDNSSPFMPDESLSAANDNSFINSANSNDLAVVSSVEMNDEARASNEFLQQNAARILQKDAGIKIKSAPLNPRLAAIVNEIKASVKESAAETAANANDALFRATRPRFAPEAISNVDSPASVRYRMPIGGRLSSEFGNRFHPIDRKTKFHKGIDIAAPKGTPVAAAASGTVVSAGWSNGYGNLVVIEHADGRQTRYAHADKLFVSAGETVQAGQTIARVGSTGKSTGAHLHFEIVENNRQVNPLEILSQDLPASSR